MASPVRTFRLADDLWSRLLVAAGEADLTPGAFVVRAVCTAIEPTVARKPVAPSIYTEPFGPKSMMLSSKLVNVSPSPPDIIEKRSAGDHKVHVGPVARTPGSMLKGGKK